MELKPLTQTIFELGPRQPSVAPAPVVEYQERYTQLPNSINVNTAVSQGIDWGAISQSAVELGGVLFKYFMPNLEQKKKDSMTSLNLDASETISKIGSEYKILQTNAEITGVPLTESQHATFEAELEYQNQSFSERLKEVLGVEEYARLTGPQPKLDDISESDLSLSVATRKHLYGVKSQIRETLMEAAMSGLKGDRRASNTKDFHALNQTMDGLPRNYSTEDAAKVPYSGIGNGILPLGTGLPSREDNTSLLSDESGNILISKTGIPALIKTNNIYYVNPAFPLDEMVDSDLKLLSILDVQGGNVVSKDGTRLHPSLIKDAKKWLSGSLSPQEAYGFSVKFSLLTTDQLATFASKEGPSAEDTTLLTMLHNAGRTGDNSSKRLEDLRLSISDPTNRESLLNSAKVMEELVYNNDTKRYFVPDVAQRKDAVDVLNQLTTTLSTAGLLINNGDNNEYNLAIDTGSNYTDGGTDPSKNMLDFLRSNRHLTGLVLRAYSSAVLINPALVGITDPSTRSTEIKKATSTFLDIELKAAKLTTVGGKLVRSAGISTLRASALEGAPWTNVINGLTHNSENIEKIMEKKVEFENMSRDDKLVFSAKASLRQNFQSNILPTDTPSVAKQKAREFVLADTVPGDERVVSFMLDSLGTADLSRNGMAIGRSSLADGDLIRLKEARNPALWAAKLGMVVPEGMTADMAARSLSFEKQLEYTSIAFTRLLPAYHWGVELNTNSVDTLETKNGGAPIMFSSMLWHEYGSDGITHSIVDIMPSVIPKSRLVYGALYSPHELLLGKNMESMKAEEAVYATSAQMKEEMLGTTNSTAIKRDVSFPASDNPAVLMDFHASMQDISLSYKRTKEKFGEGVPVNGKEEMMSALFKDVLYGNITKIVNADPNFKDSHGDSLLPGFLEGFMSSEGLYSEENYAALWAEGKQRNFTTSHQYYNLLLETIKVASKNDPATSAYHSDVLAANIGTMKLGSANKTPDFVPIGPKRGLILWEESSRSFVDAVSRLSQSGYGIYRDKRTGETYAFFSQDNISSNFVLEHAPKFTTQEQEIDAANAAPQKGYSWNKIGGPMTPPYSGVNDMGTSSSFGSTTIIENPTDIANRVRHADLQDTMFSRLSTTTSPLQAANKAIVDDSIDPLKAILSDKAIVVKGEGIAKFNDGIRRNNWMATPGELNLYDVGFIYEQVIPLGMQEVLNDYHDKMADGYAQAQDVGRGIAYLASSNWNNMVDFFSGGADGRQRTYDSVAAAYDTMIYPLLPTPSNVERGAYEIERGAYEIGNWLERNLGMEETKLVQKQTPEQIQELQERLASSSLTISEKTKQTLDHALGELSQKNQLLGFKMREATPEEAETFNPAIMFKTTADKQIILHPNLNEPPEKVIPALKAHVIFTWLSGSQTDPAFNTFDLTDNQKQIFKGVMLESTNRTEEMRYHILTSLLVGDKQVGESTPEQDRLVGILRAAILKPYPHFFTPASPKAAETTGKPLSKALKDSAVEKDRLLLVYDNTMSDLTLTFNADTKGLSKDSTPYKVAEQVRTHLGMEALQETSYALLDVDRQKNSDLTGALVSMGAIGSFRTGGDVEEGSVQVTRAKYPPVWNADNSLSNIVTMSFQESADSPSILIPTVVGGKVVSNKEAIAHYKKTGEHFGIFSTPEKATEYAIKLHQKQELDLAEFETGWLPLIKDAEQYHIKAFNNDGHWTVGYGSTSHMDGRPIKEGDTMTDEEAILNMRHYVYKRAIPALAKSIPHWDDMTNGQQGALISFAHNFGVNFYGGQNRETITKALSSKENWDLVPSALALYNKATINGRWGVQGGLVKRRQAEISLWNGLSKKT